jgi:hypothetical protein
MVGYGINIQLIALSLWMRPEFGVTGSFILAPCGECKCCSRSWCCDIVVEKRKDRERFLQSGRVLV